jgi:hypothetical protein
MAGEAGLLADVPLGRLEKEWQRAIDGGPDVRRGWERGNGGDKEEDQVREHDRLRSGG